jgi:uncharacterized protein (DUF362 family)/Pyruvate/2-oxoacid:ferredoxin oxidoreductase delta subunit
VEAALEQAMNALGGMPSFVRAGQRVLIKVNLLTRRPPEAAVTTHPALVRAVIREVQKAGGHPVIYDSPGGPFTTKSLEAVYEATGMATVAAETGAELNWDVSSVEVPNPSGMLFQGLTLSRAVVEADVVINLPKLKTHGLTRYTGAVKNLFGCIPGLTKAEYHLRLPELPLFSRFLVELAQFVRPALTIMDAVVGMEGEGPSAGRPRKLGLVLAGSSPFALDRVALALIGLKADEVETAKIAAELGLAPPMEDIAILGEDISSLAVRDFAVPPPGGTSFRLLGRRLSPDTLKIFARWLKPRPLFAAAKCRRCGICLRDCPAKALTMGEHRPEVDLARCIRCFCCQELCPEQAVSIYRPALTRWIFRH